MQCASLAEQKEGRNCATASVMHFTFLYVHAYTHYPNSAYRITSVSKRAASAAWPKASPLMSHVYMHVHGLHTYSGDIDT